MLAVALAAALAHPLLCTEQDLLPEGGVAGQRGRITIYCVGESIDRKVGAPPTTSLKPREGPGPMRAPCADAFPSAQARGPLA